MNTVGDVVTEASLGRPVGLHRPCRSSDIALSVTGSDLRVLSGGVNVYVEERYLWQSRSQGKGQKQEDGGLVEVLG